jgi:hypothetical protein
VSRDAVIEACAHFAHDEWMREKMRRGVVTWPNEAGIEQLVPYEFLNESIRDFDRIVVGAIIDELVRRGDILPTWT